MFKEVVPEPYRRLGIKDGVPEMLYVSPFHKKIEFPRRCRCSRLRFFRFSKIVIFDDLVYESYTVLFARIFFVATPGPWNKANDGL